MFTTNIIIFSALSIGLLFLSFVMLFLATQHDKVTTQAAPIRRLEELQEQITGKERTLTDLDDDLKKRREALANLAGLGAEVDALERKQAELLTEWNQMEQRRNEIAALRAETEETLTTKLAVDGELATSRANLADVAQRLEKAEGLVHKIDALTEESQVLDARVKEMREALRGLEEAARQVATLEADTRRLESEKAATEGKLAAMRAELADTEERLSASKAGQIAARQDLDQIAADLAAARQKALDLEVDHTSAISRLVALEKEAQLKETQMAEAQSRLATALAELEETESLLDDAQSEQAEIRGEHDRLGVELAVKQQKLADTQLEHTKAQEHLGILAARKAALEREIEKSRGIAAGGTGETEVDPLLELKQPPQVVAQLRAWPKIRETTEADALKRVKTRFEAFGLDYPDRTLRAFHTAMKVNDTTQMTVLAGISGTGKSQLPRQYAAGMGIGFLQVPVQPRWDSPQDLMGFYNYIEGRFRPTDLARAMYALDAENNPDAVQDRLMMVLLDEMNLARVEYYFSDFLSRLESRPAPGKEADKNMRKDAEIELEIPKASLRIFPGYNLLFAGTMNEDESTQSLSDKVVDRANVMRFGAPKKITKVTAIGRVDPEQALSRADWQRWCASKLQHEDQLRAEKGVNDMLEMMQAFGKPFGHRLGRAVLAYAGAYPAAEGVTDRVSMALADQIEMRLLPKLRSVDVEEHRSHFDSLKAMATDFGDDVLGEAIEQSVEAASAGTGQFVWKGVMR